LLRQKRALYWIPTLTAGHIDLLGTKRIFPSAYQSLNAGSEDLKGEWLSARHAWGPEFGVIGGGSRAPFNQR
jgi:hypothetical protein